MPASITRRQFPAIASAAIISGVSVNCIGEEKQEKPKANGPVEQDFQRDYDPPDFQPRWKSPQINRQLVQDFVIFAHSDLEMTKQLLEKFPGLLNAAVDWGNGDWETALGGASHMGRRDIVKTLLKAGARIDIFCAAMLGLTNTVKEILALEPSLVDAKGPHGFSLHFHAQVGGKQSKETLQYLQTVKKIKLGPVPPFVKQ